MANKPANSSEEVNDGASVSPSVETSSAPVERRQAPRKFQRGGGQGGGGYRGGGQAGDDGGRGGKRPGYFQGRRKVCPIKIEEIDWKNMDALRYFVNESGNIRSRRKTGATAKLQRRVAVAVKRARHMALLPYTGEHVRLYGNKR